MTTLARKKEIQRKENVELVIRERYRSKSLRFISLIIYN